MSPVFEQRGRLNYGPHPEEPAGGGRLEGWATGDAEASWFETRFALLTMRGDIRRRSSARWHLVGFRQGRIKMVPVVAAHAIRHRLRREASGIVEARRMDGEQLRHCRKGQVDRRAAARAETARLYVAAVGDH